MTTKSPTIVFFGSGPVAAKSLALLAEDFTVEAVITKPRPAHHKGAVPVLELAATLGLPTFTASSRSELDALFANRPVTARLAVLIDFGIIVSQSVIDYFELGIVNSHFSLLPQWRGADPITFALLSGQPKTGVSLMLLTAGMDEGPILASSACELAADTTIFQLTDLLIDVSHGLLQTVLPPYLSGDAMPISQADNAALWDMSPEPSYSRKLTKADGVLDVLKPAEQLEREIRAFAEWPKSRLTLGDVEVIITQAHALPADFGAVGDIEIGSTNGGTGTLQVQCGAGCLCVDRLKPAGKQEMSAAEFIRGYGNRLAQ